MLRAFGVFSLVLALLGPILSPSCRKMAPRWPKMARRWRNIAPRWPKMAPRWPNIAQHSAKMSQDSLQEHAQDPKKLKKQQVFSTIFKGFDLRFRSIFWCFFEESVELISNCEWKLRSPKIVIFLRENHYFSQNPQNLNSKFDSKIHVKLKTKKTFKIVIAKK